MEKNESRKKRRREKSHIMAKCCRWNQNENCRHCHHHHHLLLSLTLFFSLCDIFCVYFAGVTILVSQTVLSLLIRRVITKTSEAIPLLGSELNSKTKSFPHSHSHESNQIKWKKQQKKQNQSTHLFSDTHSHSHSFYIHYQTKNCLKHTHREYQAVKCVRLCVAIDSKWFFVHDSKLS